MKNGLDDKAYNHKGQIMTGRQFVDAIIADNYTTFKSRHSGAVKRHSLSNGQGSSFDLTPVERKYAERVLRVENCTYCSSVDSGHNVHCRNFQEAI